MTDHEERRRTIAAENLREQRRRQRTRIARDLGTTPARLEVLTRIEVGQTGGLRGAGARPALLRDGLIVGATALGTRVVDYALTPEGEAFLERARAAGW